MEQGTASDLFRRLPFFRQSKKQLPLVSGQAAAAGQLPRFQPLLFSFFTHTCHLGALGMGLCWISAAITRRWVKQQHSTRTAAMMPIIAPADILTPPFILFDETPAHHQMDSPGQIDALQLPGKGLDPGHLSFF
jgi:hypothetical protein